MMYSKEVAKVITGGTVTSLPSSKSYKVTMILYTNKVTFRLEE